MFYHHHRWCVAYMMCRILQGWPFRDWEEGRWPLLHFFIPKTSRIFSLPSWRSSLRCIDNLRRAVKRFSSDALFTKRDCTPNRSADHLLNPPIALHPSCQNQLLKNEKQPFSIFLSNCRSCNDTVLKVSCKASERIFFLSKTINPKYTGKQRTKKGGGHLRWPETLSSLMSLLSNQSLISQRST